MKRLLFFLCLIILGGILCHPSANASIYWDDDFEIPLAQSGKWVYLQGACSGTQCPYLVDISNDAHFSGTQSLRLNYGSIQGDDTHNVGIVRTVPQTDPTLFTRFYYRTKAFTYSPSPVVTTHFYQEDLGTGVVHLPDSGAMGIAVQTSEDCYFKIAGVVTLTQDCYANWIAFPKTPAIRLQDDTWYCIETETTMNSLGMNNAVLRLWVDGVLTVEYTNFRLRGMLPNGPNGNSSLSGFNAIHIYKQTGTGLMYFDRFAVGDTRIGCLTLGKDITAPVAPANLDIR